MAGTKLGKAKAGVAQAARFAEVQADLATWRGLPPLYKSRATPAKLNLWEVVQTMKRLAPRTTS